MKAAGLDIGETVLRASVVGGFAGIKRAHAFEEVRLPATQAERAEAVRELVQRFRQVHGIKGVVVGLGFRDFLHHMVELPLKSEVDIRRALPFEMESRLPLAPEEFVFDYHVVERTAKGSKCLVFSIRRERLEWIVEALRDTGVRLLAVRCSMLEAINGFLATSGGGDTVFIQPAGKSYYVAGLSGSSPVRMGVFGADRAAAEIRKLSETFDKGVFMAGEGETAPLGLDVRILSVSASHRLAVSAFRKRPLDLNFMPRELTVPSVDYYPYVLAAMGAACVIIFFVTAVFSYYKDYSAPKELSAKIGEIKATARELIEVKREYGEVRKKTEFLLEFKSRANTGIRVLRELSKVLPKGAWLTGFSVDREGKVKVQGFTKGRAADIIEPLEGSRLLNSVSFSAPITRRDDVEKFYLRMEVEGK